jgi:hypothetical protein
LVIRTEDEEMDKRIEYLCIFDNQGGFCNNENTFKYLLQTNDNIKIETDKINYEDLSLEFDLQTEETEDKTLRYFHLTIYFLNNVSLDKIEQLLKNIRSIIYKASQRAPLVIWNDISFYYSIESFPIIYKLENLMRKLITKFMTEKLGLEWSSIAVPKDIKDSIKEDSIELLYRADFIQLASFLFNDYTTKDIVSLIEKIRKSEKIEDIDLIELKELIPKSNWERYFKPLVNCEGEYLAKRWGKLYLIRCKVAHNNFISKEDFNELQTLNSEIEPHIIKAIQEIDRVKITPEERNEVIHTLKENPDSDIYSKQIPYIRSQYPITNPLGEQYTGLTTALGTLAKNPLLEQYSGLKNALTKNPLLEQYSGLTSALTKNPLLEQYLGLTSALGTLAKNPLLEQYSGLKNALTKNPLLEQYSGLTSAPLKETLGEDHLSDIAKKTTKKKAQKDKKSTGNTSDLGHTETEKV